jgi:hypothetical protein
MKKSFTLASLLLAAVGSVFSQETSNEEGTVSKKIPCTSFMKTPALRDILKTIPDIDEETYFANTEPKDHKQDRYHDLTDYVDPGITENGGVDPALQTTPAWRKENWLKAQWSGTGGLFPPDPTGAAGQDYYVQAVNSAYRIWDKDGDPQIGPKPLGSIRGGASDGDPIVMYDRYAERWFISQFRISGNKILIAISQTSDPLGEYYLYEFSFFNFPDYPKYSVWSNAYFMTANMSGNNGVAYEREKMLIGDPTASMITMSFPSHCQFFRSTATAYAEGPDAPDDDEPGWFFSLQDNGWTFCGGGTPSYDGVKIFKVDIDWSGSGSGSITTHQDLSTASFDSFFTSSWDDITQKGTSQRLDAVAGIFMYKAQYRRWDGYNTVILTATVQVGAKAGIRWIELRENNDETWYVHQEGTWSPDSDSRWMGNAAMDANGNIALAYSCAGPDTYAGLRYTGRFKDDPLGEMTVQEQIAVEGEGSQTGGNRYGDYSQMTMDPTNDMTFWFTGEWLGTGGNRRTEIFSFSSWHLLGDEEEQPLVPIFNAYQPNGDELTLRWNDIADEIVTITLIDMSGKVIAQEELNTANQSEQSYNVANNATGIYMVHMTGENTQLSKKIYIGR